MGATDGEGVSFGSGRVGLAVMRLQPLHRGHAALISLMLSDCDIGIVAVGSTQVSGVDRHPFTFAQREAMLQALFPSVRCVPLVDMGSDPASTDWVDYVLGAVQMRGLPSPTDCYAGSPGDARWYMSRFARLTDPMVRSGLAATYTSTVTNRRLHVFDRQASILPPAEELRALIEQDDPAWQAHVPARLAGYIEAHYPGGLRGR